MAAPWCGATGQTAHCQAGVFLGDARRTGDTRLDRRLFLPEAWVAADHVARWQAGRIPAGGIFQTQAELPVERVEPVEPVERVQQRVERVERVERVQQRGERGELVRQRGALPATWLVCDEWVGRNQALVDRRDVAGRW